MRGGDNKGHDVATDNKDIETLHNNIKQYTTIKLIMEKNSDYMRVDTQRVKIVDCQVMCIMLADLIAHKNILKV